MTCDLLASLRKIEIPYPVWVVDNGSDCQVWSSKGFPIIVALQAV